MENQPPNHYVLIRRRYIESHYDVHVYELVRFKRMFEENPIKYSKDFYMLVSETGNDWMDVNNPEKIEWIDPEMIQ